jgi:hypothetical protein
MHATVCVCVCVCVHSHICVHIRIHIQTVATHTKSITRKSVLNTNLYTSSMVDNKACCCCCFGSQETSMQTKHFQSPMKRKKTPGPIICQGIFAILFHNPWGGGLHPQSLCLWASEVGTQNRSIPKRKQGAWAVVLSAVCTCMRILTTFLWFRRMNISMLMVTIWSNQTQPWWTDASGSLLNLPHTIKFIKENILSTVRSIFPASSPMQVHQQLCSTFICSTLQIFITVNFFNLILKLYLTFLNEVCKMMLAMP